MSIKQLAGGDERIVRRYEYEDRWVLAADVGVDDENLDVDVVGTTAIVVAETGGEISEAEFELPGTNATITTNNGVLTITVEQ
ncbi:Hsp20/alpha crystallin family protein [Halobellus captivus]|uniref:Hsp20/alpha crystallin family protein n=1 Tax=Halobellus captivus TaxID=2592614 RepID=UPI0011A7BA72|nr:Hsp20/alpha crystallin family protein [Halobellus captivus]